MAEIIFTKEQVKKTAKSLIGKTFGELNNYQTKAEFYSKGFHGQILEEDVFQYGINSNSAPDFENIGVELKVTPYKINKNGSLSAKERMVLNIINYMEEYKNNFYTSHFWYKNKMIQIIWYLNEDNIPKDQFKITHELLFTFPAEDLIIIKHDWETIINKIKAGKAHELSEADTMYLGACTKGINSNSVRQQPFSTIMAKQRAFCLKASYMTQLVRWYIGEENVEKVCQDLRTKTFEKEIEERLESYRGLSVKALKNMFNLNSNSKSINELILAKMLGVNGKISNKDEFLKANIVPKTIRVNSNGKIKESMSFPNFTFEKIILGEWEESDLYNMFSTTKFMFVVFNEVNDEYCFSHVKFWNMPIPILDNEIRKVWEKTVKIIKDGDIVKEIINGKRKTNFPAISDNEYCHVRPHGQNSNDTYQLPIKDKLTGLSEYTKQCFWLNSSYISKIIK